MAGIISNVDDDVQKLRKLKNEIENVKKALMGINITVDIDIAKGLQSQLTSLIGQYDALVDKIAATEGKIMLSVSRINKATEKIVQAQEKVSKVVSAPAQIGDANTQTNTAETASIQAQAKAYDDLKTKINDILGTRDANIKRMVEEMNAIRLINAEIKKINKSQGESSSLSSAQQKRLEQLNNSLLTHKTALSEVRQALNNNAKLDNVAATSMNGLSQSLSRMRIAYRELTEEERNSPLGKELLASIQQADAKIKELDATIGNHQRNVGNYGRQWNGLSMSIQQVGRELPSLAYGPKVFFSAISNNLPILADEIKRARTEYELLKKSGQAATPVWKQVISSLFSWQSALTVGITLLTLYGDKVVDWVAGLFKVKDALQDVVSYQQNLSKITSEGARNSARERVELDTLYKATQNHKRSLEERNKAADKLQKKYPSYFGNLSNEAILAGNAASAYKSLTENLLKAAQARAAMKIIEENYNKIYQLQKAINADTNWTNRNKEKTKGGTASVTAVIGGSITGYTQTGEVLTDEAIEYNRRTKALQENKKAVDALKDANNALIDSIDVSAFVADNGNISGVKDINAYTDQLHRITELERKQTFERQRQQQDLDNQLEQSRIDNLQDGYEKEQAQRELMNKKEIQALGRQKEDYIRAYIQNQKEIFDAQEDLKAKQTKDYVKKSFSSSSISVDTSVFDSIIGNTRKRQYSDEIREQEASWNEYLVKFGNYQQKRKAIIDKYDQAIKEASNAGDEGILEEEKRQQLNDLDEQYGKTTRSMADLFEDASNKSVSAIQSIIDKYETLVKYMSGTKESDGTNVTLDELKALGFTDKDIEKIEKGEISIKDVTDAIKGLKDELKGKSPWQAFVSDLEKGIEAIKKGGNDSKKIGQGITDIGNAVTSFAPALNEFGSSIADIFGFDDSKITSAIDALGGLGQTASGVGQIMSGDIVGGAMSAVSGISSVVSALDGMFGADYSHYNEMVEEYTRLNEIWDELIDKKQEYISISYGMEVDKVGEEALGLVEKQIEAYRLLGKERLNSGASAGSHSIGKRMAKNTSSSDWQDIADALDMSVNAAKEFIGTGRMTGLFDLTVEQLEKLKSEAPAFWAKMDGDVQEYLNGIIDGEERIEDIQNQISEQLTQTTFDSVFDSFVDTLMDMGSSAKDFSDSFSGYMQRAVLTTMVGNKFTEDLQTWYDAFAQANKDQGGITKEEMEALRKQYDAIAGSALAERDKLAEIFGWTKEDIDSSTDNYENFIGSMQDSLTSLDVTAKDVSDNIYDYFRQAMINALYEKEYKSKMEELYKTFEGLSKDGLSESDMVQLGSRIDQYIEQMMKGVEDVNSLFADKLKNAEDLQSFVDSVKSAMSSIEATAEDITDNIFEYIRQQMVEKMFADTFQPQIEEFYKRVQKAMSDGDITDAERNTLRSEAEKLANDIVAAKDILSDTLGITESNMKKELEEEFKSFSDGILNSLTNAEVTAEAVAKNISESMRKELIESMYIEQYEPRIKAIWEKWKEYSEDGLVTDEERANIKNDIDELSKEVADAAGEISDAWKDSGEEVRKAFNSFSDSIKSVLYDAEATAEDIADNIYQYMRNALVDSMFTAQLQPQIQAWYDKYTEFMKDGAIDTAERKTLDKMIAEIQKAGVDIVDAANKLFPTLDTGAINRAEEAAQEAENARNEAEQEWESFSDGILNSLYDIEATAEDISDDMSEYMRKALIKAMYVENFKPQMQKWYNEWKKAMGDDDLTSEEKQLLDSMKQTMVDDMKKEVDAINQFFGTMFSQQASSKGFEAMSQDTGEELNGRFTALQVAGEEIKNQSIQQTGLLSSINGKLSLLNLRSEDVPTLLSGTPNFADRAKETIASGYQSQVHIVFPTEDIKALTDKVSNMERIVDEMRTFQVEGNMDRRDILENSVILAKNSPRILDNTNDIKQDIKNL